MSKDGEGDEAHAFVMAQTDGDYLDGNQYVRSDAILRYARLLVRLSSMMPVDYDKAQWGKVGRGSQKQRNNGA